MTLKRVHVSQLQIRQAFAKSHHAGLSVPKRCKLVNHLIENCRIMIAKTNEVIPDHHISVLSEKPGICLATLQKACRTAVMTQEPDKYLVVE